ncbi:hypothetical protein HPP92_015605 [Vanilla planifolia]|uniref:EF-hand domain-containing protein n=1 Tax=Vanilla planifolia TaxID=51239 RepID=A0A835QK10_VANPL|nr:hypothetical protein HPP92_015605 [Vanilla planifolia]
MENISSNSLLSSEPIGFYIVEAILSSLFRLRKQSARLLSSFSFFSRTSFELVTAANQNREEVRTEAEAIIRREEVEVVMERLGLMGTNVGGKKLEDLIRAKEVAALFEEEEPSLLELKEAFAVFDANGDGFVDAWELQRVLCKLGFEEGVRLDSCVEMIEAHDGNGDGRVDFGEFVQLLQNSFY